MAQAGDTLDRGLGMGFNYGMQNDAQAHAEKMQDNQFSRAKQATYEAHIADAGIQGRLAGPVGGQNSVELPNAPVPYAPGKGPSQTYEMGKPMASQPGDYKLQGYAGAKPEGATITTHELAAMMGVKPQGPNMWMKAPPSEMDTFIKKFQITHGASRQDEIDKDAREIFKAVMSDSINGEQYRKDPKVAADMLAAMRKTMSDSVKGGDPGKYPDPPKMEEKPSGPGLLDNFMSSVALIAQEMGFKAPSAPAAPAATKVQAPPQRTISRTDSQGNQEWGPAGQGYKDPATGKPPAIGALSPTGAYRWDGKKWAPVQNIAKRG
jgi:hypothetical protein